MKGMIKAKVTVVPIPDNAGIQLYDLAHNSVANQFRFQTKRDAPLSLGDWQPQHMYFTSDRPVKTGDWVLATGDGSFYNTFYPKQQSEGDKKEGNYIEATTDPILVDKKIPDIGAAFLSKFADKNGAIQYVNIESKEVDNYVWMRNPDNGDRRQFNVPTEVAKLRDDRTVIIHPIKDSWDRDEVKKLLRDMHQKSKYSHDQIDSKEKLEDYIERILF